MRRQHVKRYSLVPPRLDYSRRVIGLIFTMLFILAGCSGPQIGGGTGEAVGRAAALNASNLATTSYFDPSEGAALPYNRIVAAYGIVGGVDVNGPASTLDMLDRFLPELQRLGKEYADLDPTHPVKLGIDLVVNVLQPCSAFPQFCSSWADDATIQAYIDYCQKHDLLLFFDVQLGTEPVEHAVTTHLQKYLEQYSFTHLALDTEFHWPNNKEGYAQAAGYPCCLGWMDASEINWASDKLAQISLQKHLPRKVLVVHEWNSYVLPNKDKIRRNPNVSLVLQSDGFGAYYIKLARYQEFVQQELLLYGGYKVFFHYSEGAYDYADFNHPAPQSPAEVLQIFPQPLFISYQ